MSSAASSIPAFPLASRSRGPDAVERVVDIARFGNGKEQCEAYLRRIEANLPPRGDVHITELHGSAR